MKEFTLSLINAFCLNTQHLTGESKNNNLSQVVRDIGGLHSTLMKTAYLALLARMDNFSPGDFEKAMFEDFSLARIRCFRKTIYVLPADLLTAAFGASKNLIAIKPQHYEPYLQMTMDEYGIEAQKITKLLKGKKLSSKEIKDLLESDKKVSNIVNIMCDQGILIRLDPVSGWKGNTHNYRLLSEVFPQADLNQYDEFSAREIILKYYLDTFGPATIEDAAWWTGFRKTEVKKVFTLPEILKIVVSGLDGDYYITKNRLEKLKSFSPREKDQTALLPFLDPYIMGYKKRERYMDMTYWDYIFDRSGNAAPTILINGRVTGVWDFLEKPEPAVKVYFFNPPNDHHLESIMEQAKQIGIFLAGKEVEVQICTNMTPLNKRTAGSFMSPLKVTSVNV